MAGFHVLPWAFQEHCQSCSLEGVTLLNLANQSLWPSSWHNGWETCSSVWIDFTWVGHRLSNLQKLFPGPTLGYGAKVPQKGAPWWRIKEERKKVKLSRVRLFATLWTVAHQASPSMEFSRQEYRSGHQSNLCDLMDYGPSGSSVRGILQARIPEWVAISFSRINGLLSKNTTSAS